MTKTAINQISTVKGPHLVHA